jgi:hypothetical protein
MEKGHPWPWLWIKLHGDSGNGYDEGTMRVDASLFALTSERFGSLSRVPLL